MTIAAFRRAVDDDALLRRARRGDRRARQILVTRHAERAVEVVDLIVGDAYDVTPLATRVLDVALASEGPIDDAIVRAAVRLCTPMQGASDLRRLVLVLTDVEGWSEDGVADLLGLPVANIADLRAAGRTDAGIRSTLRTDCRGWRLVVTRERATEHERGAGEAHLLLCRACRRRDVEQQETRDRLRSRGAVARSVLAADVVALAVPTGGAASAAGIAGLIFGKVWVAGIGSAVVAVAIASAGVAATRHGERTTLPHDRSTRPVATSPSAPATQDPTPAATVGTSTTANAPASTVTASTPSRLVTVPSLPSIGTTSLPQLSTGVPLPTSSVTSIVPLPTLSPTSLLTPLPLTPLPVPSVSVPSTGSLLGH